MDQLTTIETEPQQEFRFLPLALIDDPQAPIRETMDEKALAELVASIMEAGLIEPLIVKDTGTRWEVVAGHRRWIACGIAGMNTVPCMIRGKSDVSDLAIMIHENAFREDMNPVEEARFYARALQELCSNDVDILCEKVRRDRNFVEGRLLLLIGYAPVVAALEAGKIGIAHARALNKLKNVGFLPNLLDSAVNQGATARAIAEWVRDADQLPTLELPADNAAASGDASAAALVDTTPRCLFCLSQKHAHVMKMVWLHHTCSDLLDSALGRAEDTVSG